MLSRKRDTQATALRCGLFALRATSQRNATRSLDFSQRALGEDHEITRHRPLNEGFETEATCTRVRVTPELENSCASMRTMSKCSGFPCDAFFAPPSPAQQEALGSVVGVFFAQKQAEMFLRVKQKIDECGSRYCTLLVLLLLQNENEEGRA